MLLTFPLEKDKCSVTLVSSSQVCLAVSSGKAMIVLVYSVHLAEFNVLL